MTALCILDTSVFVEILRVPVKAKRWAATADELREKIKAEESLFLPMATIIETGNHIGQNGDGRERRDAAERFVEQVRLALAGESPFQPMDFLEAAQLHQWLTEFPDQASRGSELGDLAIIHDWKRLKALQPQRRVYIWSFDNELAAYDHHPVA